MKIGTMVWTSSNNITRSLFFLLLLILLAFTTVPFLFTNAYQQLTKASFGQRSLTLRNSQTRPSVHIASKPRGLSAIQSVQQSASSSAETNPSWFEKIGLWHNSWWQQTETVDSTGLEIQSKQQDKVQNDKPPAREQKGDATTGLVEITTLEDFYRYWYGTEENDDYHSQQEEKNSKQTERTRKQRRDYVSLLKRLSVKGNTQIIGSKDHPNVVHPVVQLLHERRRHRKEQQLSISKNEGTSATGRPVNASTNTTPLNNDGKKIALVIEGGGMRGCVSAGMVCALHYLGLQDSIDVVYGASAGSIVGAYFCSGQLPWFGPEVYYDALTTAGDKFIDFKRFLRSLGFGLVDPRLLKDVLTRPDNGKPLLNLHYLLEATMQESKPLDWKKFQKRQAVQPLKVVTTGLKSEKPVVLSQESGHFDTLEDLCNCLHASCLLPGIAGPVMNVLKDPKNHKTNEEEKPIFVIQNGYHEKNEDGDEYEPLGDSMLSAPIPYQIAHEDGATHVVVVRSTPDGTNLMAGTAANSMWETLIFRRFFLRKNFLPGMHKRLKHDYQHQRIYAYSILDLNGRASMAAGNPKKQESISPHTMTIALKPGTEEVSHLETSREAIFEGVREGFARAYDALVDDPTLRGQGHAVARKYFPDEILDYDPNEILSLQKEQKMNNENVYECSVLSAFEAYLQIGGITPKAWITSIKGKKPTSDEIYEQSRDRFSKGTNGALESNSLNTPTMV